MPDLGKVERLELLFDFLAFSLSGAGELVDLLDWAT
jgi:hypothetical protein